MILLKSESRQQLNQRKKGAVLSVLNSAAQAMVGLLYVPLLLNGIGQSEYGLYQFIGSIIAYITIINTTLSAGITRYYSMFLAEDNKENMSNVLAIALRLYRIAYVLIAVVVAIFIVLLRLVYANSLSAQEINEGSLMLGVLALNAIVLLRNTISIAVITAYEKFVFLRLVTLASIILQPVIVAIGIIWFPYALTISIVQLLLNIAVCVIQHLYAKNKLEMKANLFELDSGLRDGLLRFSSGILLAVIADQIFWKTDQIILAYFWGLDVVAVYAIGSQIFFAYMALGTAIPSVFLPKISSLYHQHRNMEEISKLFTKLGRISFYVLFLILSLFVIFGKDFIFLWAGSNFLDAYWITIIILVPFTIDLVQCVGLTILQVMDKYHFRARLYLFGAIINIALTLVLAYYFQGIGAASATAVSVVLTSGFILNWYYKSKIKLDISSFWKNILSVSWPLILLMSAFVVFWQTVDLETSWISFTLGVIAYIIAYGATAFVFAMNNYEKGLILTALNKMYKR